MVQIFAAFLITSAIGTLLAIILTLIRPLTRKLFSGTWHYYIWLAVLIVMVLPIRLELPEPSLNEPQISYNEMETNDISENTKAPTIKKEEGKPSAIRSAQSFFIKNKALFAFIWLSCAVILFLIKLISYRSFLKKIYKNSEEISCPEVGSYTKRKIRTRVSDKICSPFIVGLIKPTLMLPKKDMTPLQLNNILAHEMTHLRRNDILYKWFCIIVRSIHWFNPAIYLICEQINIDCEISCDLAVVRGMDEQQEKNYIETILSLLSQNNSKSIPMTTGMTGKETLKRRFIMIKNKTKISKKAAIISTVLAVLILLAALLASGILNGAFGSAGDENKTEICALVKEIKDDMIVLDIVEYITPEDTERIAELGLTESDLINGYYIHNDETEAKEYFLTDSTIYSFIDWKNDFVKEGDDRHFSGNKEDFMKYLNTYENAQPKMPFFIVVSGNKIVSITENIMM